MRTDRGWRRFYATGWLVSACITGVAFRMWQLRMREAEQRAEEAERTRDEAATRRAMEERLRIARELHDSLTHSISVVNVQAGVAAHLARKRGEEVPAAIEAISEASSEAARELRATLDVLRREDDRVATGLDRLATLVERARAAGVPTTVRTDGTPRALPCEVDATAYRIVQEALTNVTRHAGRAGATVTLTYAAEALVVQVDDDGAGVDGRTATPVHGLGLVGMRERVSALGGTLRAGPAPGGGFTVRAELPLQDET